MSRPPGPRGDEDVLVRNCRIVVATATVLVVAFAEVFRVSVPDSLDPPAGRLFFSALGVGVYLSTHASLWAKRHCVGVTSTFLYLLTAWFLILAHLNDFAAEYTLGLVFTIAAAGFAILVTHRGTMTVLAYGVSSTVATAALLPIVDDLQTNPWLITAFVTGTAAVIFLAARLRAHLLQSLSFSEQRFRKLSEAAFEAVLIVDGDRIVDANTSALVLLGIPSSRQILGCTLRELMPRDEYRHAEKIMAGRTLRRVETAVLRNDGSIVPVEMRGRVAMHQGSNVRVVVVRDVSEQKRYERELIDSRRKVEEALAARNTIINNVSHEFRTPLAIMLGYSEMLKDGAFDDARELGGLIYESGRKLNDTLNLILELAQIDGGGFSLVMEPLDVAELASEVVETHRPRAESKGIRLELEAGEGVSEVTADRLRVLKIMDYLVDNAVKFTEQGDVSVRVESDVDAVCIGVSDTGAGIGDEYLPHLFEPFSQESAGLTRSHGGIGVGLAIAKHMVEVMGGSIEVRSTRGRGSTFVVRFPLAPENHSPSIHTSHVLRNAEDDGPMWR